MPPKETHRSNRLAAIAIRGAVNSEIARISARMYQATRTATEQFADEIDEKFLQEPREKKHDKPRA